MNDKIKRYCQRYWSRDSYKFGLTIWPTLVAKKYPQTFLQQTSDFT